MTYGTVKLGPNDFLWSCSVCAAIVVNRHQHDQWHIANPQASAKTVVGG